MDALSIIRHRGLLGQWCPPASFATVLDVCHCRTVQFHRSSDAHHKPQCKHGDSMLAQVHQCEPMGHSGMEHSWWAYESVETGLYVSTLLLSFAMRPKLP